MENKEPLAIVVATMVMGVAGVALARGDFGVTIKGDTGDPAVCSYPGVDYPQVWAMRPMYPNVSTEDDADVVWWDGDIPDTDAEARVDDFQCMDGHYAKNAGNGKDVDDAYPDIINLVRESWGTVKEDNISSDWTKFTLDPGGSAVDFYIEPEHWLFEIGSDITADIPDASDCPNTTIEVGSASHFEAGDHAFIRWQATSTGEMDWTDAEHVEITGVSGQDLTIVRDCSLAQDWTSGSVGYDPHIAAIVESWGDQPGLSLNLSPEVVAAGQSGWEIGAEYLKAVMLSRALGRVYPVSVGVWITKSKVDGLHLDGARWLPDSGGLYTDSQWYVDVDNDGVADWGYVDGVQTYGLGGLLMIAELRRWLTDDLNYNPSWVPMIGVDSNIPHFGYRTLGEAGMVNGVEVENYIEATDNYGNLTGTSISSALLFLRERAAEVDASGYQNSTYPMTKKGTNTFGCEIDSGVHQNVSDDTATPANDDSAFRVGLASALLAGTPHAYSSEDGIGPNAARCYYFYEWDEYYGGALRDWDWLGGTYGDAVRVSESGDTWSPTLSIVKDTTCEYGGSGSYSTHGTYGAGGQVEIVSVCDVPYVEGVRVESTGTPSWSPGGSYYDISVGFDAYTESDSSYYSSAWDTGWPLDHTDMVDNLPRLFRVKVEFSGGSCSLSTNEQTQDFWMRPSDEDWETYAFTFTYIPTTCDLSKVSVASGDQVGIWYLVDLEVTAASADRWVRYFDNGAVLLNASSSDWTYGLDSDGSYAMDGYHYLDGDQNSSYYHNGADLDTAIGSPDYTIVTVPAGDAMFVVHR
ncbi:MAG: hypothetical protein H6739_30115 [Alphaproteobacteria bacterium]|nr:hypothetical protein [Alphaproteobacteria bacterium]